MIRAGVGRSRTAASRTAGAEAARAALAQAGTDSAAFVIVYATILHEQQEVLAGVREVVGPGVPLVGGSAQGISTSGAVEEVDRVVGVAVVSASPALRIRTAVSESFAADPAAAARQLAEGLGAPPDGQLVLLWYDPLTGGDMGQLISTLDQIGFSALIGGATSHRWDRYSVTFQYHGDRVLQGAVVGLWIEGAVRLDWAVTNGTEPLGVELEITRCEGNRIHTIGGRPALDVWEEHLGEIRGPDDLGIWALGIPSDQGADPDGENLITRGVFGFDTEARTLTLHAGIPSGTRVQLCHRTPSAVIGRALAMVRHLRGRLEAPPLLVLSFECAGRSGPFLGEDGARQEIIGMQQILGEEVPWLGLYAWGEIAPLAGRTRLFNFAFPLAVLIATEG